MRIPITIDGREQPLKREPEPLRIERRPTARYGFPRRRVGWEEPEPLTPGRTTLGEGYREDEDHADDRCSGDAEQAEPEQPLRPQHEPRTGTEGTTQDWKDRYVRLLADFENYKRHAESQREKLSGIGREEVLADIFPLVEHMERAIRAARDAEDTSGILQGIELVYKELLSVLEKHGVERVETVGRPFDPRIHEAVALLPAPGSPPHTIVEEIRAGFQKDGKLLRPASVIVAE